MQVIVVDSPDQLILDLQVVLVKSLGAQFHFFQDVEQALNHIEKAQEIILVICRYEMKKINVFQKVSNHLIVTHGLSVVPILVRSQTPLKNPEIVLLDESSLEDATTQVLNYTADVVSAVNKKKHSYIPVTAEKFLALDVENLVCDVFIRIQKKDMPDQYVKRLHASDKFSVQEVERYMNLGLKEFFIPEFQYSKFLNMISIEIIRSLKNQRFESLDKTQLVSFGFETVLDRLKLFNIVDDITIHLVNENIKTISKNIEKAEALFAFFQTISFQKTSYAFSHCYLIALLSEKLAKNFEWNTPQARDKLIYLAFFHDISLKNLDWHKIESNEELEKSNLKRFEKELILSHATDSAELLDKFKDIPFGLSQLVKEHHGTKSGVGFTKELSLNISPMAMMFVVLEEFASRFIKGRIETMEEMEMLINEMSIKFSKSAYQQTVTALKSVIKSPI